MKVLVVSLVNLMKWGRFCSDEVLLSYLLHLLPLPSKPQFLFVFNGIHCVHTPSFFYFEKERARKCPVYLFTPQMPVAVKLIQAEVRNRELDLTQTQDLSCHLLALWCHGRIMEIQTRPAKLGCGCSQG